jgi:serine protease Do
MLIDLEESSAFILADEVLPNLGRIPANVFGRPLAWLGAYGLEAMDRDVANFLKLSNQSGAVISEVLEDSPAEQAGMKATTSSSPLTASRCRASGPTGS